MAEKEKDHFDKIFWFLTGCTAFSFAYAAAITFLPIPKGHERFADSLLSFLLGTVVGGGAFGFLTGSSATKNSKITPPVGTTNAEISATITTSPEPEENKDDKTIIS